MANLVAESGGNKGQLSHLAEAITRQFRVPEIPQFFNKFQVAMQFLMICVYV